jgi:hypothetical protein
MPSLEMTPGLTHERKGRIQGHGTFWTLYHPENFPVLQVSQVLLLTTVYIKSHIPALYIEILMYMSTYIWHVPNLKAVYPGSIYWVIHTHTTYVCMYVYSAGDKLGQKYMHSLFRKQFMWWKGEKTLEQRCDWGKAWDDNADCHGPW